MFFDDFKVTHSKSPVIATDDYYAGGSTFNSYTRENSVLNRIKFQETEWQDALGLNLYDVDSRLYDPFIWRTTTQDPHADVYSEQSPYSFLGNNPVNMLDPTGMDAFELNEMGSPGMAICPTCDPNNPDHKKYIDDPNNTYFHDPKNGNVSLLLNEVTVTSETSEANNTMIITAPPPEYTLPPIAIPAPHPLAIATGLMFGFFDAGSQTEMEILAKMRAERDANLLKKAQLNARNPAQDKPLSRGEIEKLKRNGWDHTQKGRSGGGKTDLYKDRDGNIYQKPKGGTGEGEPIGININDLN